MKRIFTIASLLLAVILLFPTQISAQTNPTAFDLGTGNYTFTQWDNTNAAATYPANMRFHLFSTFQDNQIVNPLHVTNADYSGAYNGTSGSRLNGTGTAGITFTNTGTSGFQGAAVVALNTTNRLNIRVSWVGSTVSGGTTTNFRGYAIALEYRVGTTGAWNIATFTPGGIDTVQYNANLTAGNVNALAETATIGTYTLPASCENQSVVQLRWRFHQRQVNTSGTRPTLGLDDISIISDANSGTPTQLGITSIIPTSPSANAPFSVTVQSQNSLGQARNVVSNTDVAISVSTGTGSLSGVLTGTITAGSNTLILTNVGYSQAETGVILGVARTSGDVLTSGVSGAFTVQAGATNIIGAGLTTNPLFTNTTLPSFTVTARRADNTTDVNYIGPITIVATGGPGVMNGTLVRACVNGVATFNDISFTQQGNYTINASGPNVGTATVGTISILQLPTMNELLVPRAMINASQSVPSFALVQFTNLQPNTYYRYHAGVHEQTLLPSAFDAGNPYLINNVTSTARAYNGLRNTNSDTTAGLFFTGPGETSKAVWIGVYPSSNASRFAIGNQLFWYVTLYDTNRVMSTRYQSVNRTTVHTFTLGLPQSANAISDSLSGLQARTMIVLYDSSNANQFPVATAVVQDDNTSVPSSPAYYAFTDNRSGGWSTIIPSNIANGIRRIEQRNMFTGALIKTWTDADGIWGGTNTVNEQRGLQTIYFNTPALVVSPSLNNQTFCTNDPIRFSWTGRGIGQINILASRDSLTFFPIATVSATPASYNWAVPDSLTGIGPIYIRVQDAERPSEVFSTTNRFIVNRPANVTQQPSNQVVCLDSRIALRTKSVGSNITYQWFKDNVIIPGATRDSLIILNAQAINSGIYRCGITGASGCPAASTNDAVVYVKPSPVITRQPSDVISGLGRTAIFSVEMNNVSDVKYQWYRGTNPVLGSPIQDNNRISGAKTSQLTITNIQQSDLSVGLDSGYVCIIEAGCGTFLLSNTGYIRTSGLAITSQPEAVFACPGSTALFSIVASTSNPSVLKYQWFKGTTKLEDDGRITGTKTQILSVNNVSIADQGDYTCNVTAEFGGETKTSTVGLLSLQTAPVIVAEPQSVTICRGDTAVFNIALQNPTGVRYKWFVGTTLETIVQIPESDSPSLTQVTDALSAASRLVVLCITTNDCGADTSIVTYINFKKQTTITQLPPETLRLSEGNPIVISVIADGENLTYQWFKNDTALTLPSASEATLSIPSSLYTDRGSYYVVVKGACGAAITSRRTVVDVVTDVEGDTYSQFALEQNTPNPFDNTTNIGFTVSTSQRMKLTITDLYGKIVMSNDLGIVNEGRHVVTVQSSLLPIGTYFYTMSHGNSTKTKRFTIVR